MKKYHIKIEREQRGNILGYKEVEVETQRKPRIGECISLCCDPPIHETVIEVRELSK